MTVYDGGGDVDELAVGGSGVLAQHLEGAFVVDGVAFHQDALRSMRKSARLPIGAPRSLSMGSWVARQHDRLATRADRLHARGNEPIEAEGRQKRRRPLD